MAVQVDVLSTSTNDVQQLLATVKLILVLTNSFELF